MLIVIQRSVIKFIVMAPLWKSAQLHSHRVFFQLAWCYVPLHWESLCQVLMLRVDILIVIQRSVIKLIVMAPLWKSLSTMTLVLSLFWQLSLYYAENQLCRVLMLRVGVLIVLQQSAIKFIVMTPLWKSLSTITLALSLVLPIVIILCWESIMLSADAEGCCADCPSEYCH